MVLVKSYLPAIWASVMFFFVLVLYVDPTMAYSNRLLRFARNDPNQPKFPPNILDLFTFKRAAGLDSLERPRGLEYGMLIRLNEHNTICMEHFYLNYCNPLILK